MSLALEAGSLVRIPLPEAPKQARMAHRLARVKTSPVDRPYVMDCGIAAGLIEPTTEEAGRCGRCWPRGDAS